MPRRPNRALVIAAVLASAGALVVAAFAATLTGPTPAGGYYSWTPGRSLAASSSLLLSAWATDCPPPTTKCATDSSPTMGVYVQRSTRGALPPRWSAPVRVSPTTGQAERATIAADGDTAIVGWVTQTSYLHYAPDRRRVFRVRVSGDGGATWGSTITLSGSRGRVDYPRVAAGGGRLFAVWTDANSGAIDLAISADGGVTWAVSQVGTTTSLADGPEEGYAGFPDIGVSGDDVAVVWFADDAGQTLALTSSAGGLDLGPASVPEVLTTTSPNDGTRYAGAGGASTPGDPRVVLAYTTDTGLAIRVFDGTRLDPERTVATWPLVVGAVTYVSGYGPAVVPTAGGLSLAFAACRSTSAPDPCDGSYKATRIDLLLTESTNAGATWSAPDVLASVSDGAGYTLNDQPSIVEVGAYRLIAYDRYQRSFRDYRVWLRAAS